jgi:hypothetical protein
MSVHFHKNQGSVEVYSNDGTSITSLASVRSLSTQDVQAMEITLLLEPNASRSVWLRLAMTHWIWDMVEEGLSASFIIRHQ